jgi:predicted nucleotidyltransferase
MKITKTTIISTLKQLKPTYEKEGLILTGLFGSYAKGEQNNFSDIDIAYEIDYNKFSTKYKDGFSKILRIEEIKQELENTFKTKVDLVPNNNKAIVNGIINV